MAARRKPERSRGGQRRAPPAKGGRDGERRPPRRRPSPRRPLRVTPAPAVATSDTKIRLNRFVAASGQCSRRAADDLIAQGRVRVNGVVHSELGYRVDPRTDTVVVDGQRAVPEKPVYVLFNKPKDVVCTNARYEVRERVIDFMRDVRGRIYTIGRLDAASEGLILLTNDGEFAQRIAHPRFGVAKIYSVVVRGRVEPPALRKARGGVWLADGRTSGLQIKVERAGNDRTFMKVMLREGKNREIRRVFARLGHNVLSLKRIRIGGLSLHGLKPGGYRFLTLDEVHKLRALASEES